MIIGAGVVWYPLGGYAASWVPLIWRGIIRLLCRVVDMQCDRAFLEGAFTLHVNDPAQ